MHSAYPPEKSWEEIFAGAGMLKLIFAASAMQSFSWLGLASPSSLFAVVWLAMLASFFKHDSSTSVFFCACNFFNLQSCWLLKTYLWYIRHNQGLTGVAQPRKGNIFFYSQRLSQTATRETLCIAWFLAKKERDVGVLSGGVEGVVVMWLCVALDAMLPCVLYICSVMVCPLWLPCATVKWNIGRFTP